MGLPIQTRIEVKPPAFWTEIELNSLERHYPQHGAAFVDEVIFAQQGWRRGRRNVMQKAQKLGIRYSGEPMGRFKPGQVPPNKGKKMPAEVRVKCASTMFKKGNVSHNTKPVGEDISVRDANRNPVVYLRISLGKWVPLARHSYESYYGKIPHGHIIAFKDGDPMNCDIKNLYLITRAQNARRNHNREKIKRDAAELTDSYVVSYFKRYRNIELNLEDLDPEFLELMRNEIKLKRSLSKKQQQ